MKFRTSYTDNSIELEISSADTKTVPDMSYSVKDIIARFTRGTLSPDDIARNVQYDGISDDEIDNIQDTPTDITDLETIARSGMDAVNSVLSQTNKVAHNKSVQETEKESQSNEQT